MPGEIVDGQDAEAVHEAVLQAGNRARAGDGPTLLEFKTYRYKGHSRTDPAAYRPEGELEQWLERDPIKILKDRMIAAGQLDNIEFEELAHAAEREVVAAIDWAKAEPYPLLEALAEDVYYRD
jgi:pyruvate dehydrogenase E1 component alpha subunit